jgi:hypothetical protein
MPLVLAKILLKVVEKQKKFTHPVKSNVNKAILQVINF